AGTSTVSCRSWRGGLPSSDAGERPASGRYSDAPGARSRGPAEACPERGNSGSGDSDEGRQRIAGHDRARGSTLAWSGPTDERKRAGVQYVSRGWGGHPSGDLPEVQAADWEGRHGTGNDGLVHCHPEPGEAVSFG